MTVIKGKQKYAFPSNSGNTTDVESLNLGSASASDTESLQNEPHRRREVRLEPSTSMSQARVIEELLTLRKCYGRRRIRRHQNRTILHTLAEEDDEEDGALVVIMEPYKNPFTKLLEDTDALQFWNAFVEKSEMEQEKILQEYSKSNSKIDTVAGKEKPFARISHKIKRSIKIKKNLPLEEFKQSEDDLLEFFKTTPAAIYIQYPPTYFQRLMLHGMAQYHGLHSLGIIEDGGKKIEVFNTDENWMPADCFLTDFITQLRN